MDQTDEAKAEQEFKHEPRPHRSISQQFFSSC